MSNVKISNAKHDGVYDPVRMKLVKSPKDSQVLRPSFQVKVKKDTDQVKRESESPVNKNLLAKKPLETPKRPLETPVKKESEFVKAVTVRKEGGLVKVVKKVPQASSKDKASPLIDKIHSVKKEEVAISRVHATSSKVVPKKKKGSKEEGEKKGKKVYDLPGQKHDPPEERDPLRIFYESLYQQNPKSEMAEVWMMEHGLLAYDAAKKAFERKKKNQLSQKMGSPVKSAKVVKVEKTASKNVTMKIEKKMIPTLNGDSKFSKAKRKLDSDDDDDFILKPKKKLKTTT